MGTYASSTETMGVYCSKTPHWWPDLSDSVDEMDNIHVESGSKSLKKTLFCNLKWVSILSILDNKKFERLKYSRKYYKWL